jgi:predicted  nucleic acid-binding Zn-ribbon protein
VIQAVPPIEERIKQLRAQAQKVDADIAEAQKEADRLSGIIKGLEERLAKAQADADDSEKKMMALEDAGVSPSDPDALRRFTQQYNEQARRHRDSAREAAALRHGVIRDARPGGEEENDVLTKPLVPAAPGREMKPEAGIERLKGDLRIAQGQVETRRNLKKLIDTRITELEKHQQATRDRLAKAREWEAALVKEADQIARRATAASIRAEQIEEEAIQILTEPGQRAAERAASAAEDASRAISDFYQKNAPQSPSPQVGFLSGYARSLVGDLKFGLALVYAQRADRLAAQERLLADAAAMGLEPAALSAEKASSEGGEAVSRSGTPSTQPAAIAQAVQDARGKAIEAAKAALEEYGKADSRLNRQWTLHTQIAAVHYLLASLEPGNASKQHLADALREYNAATRDRAERKEVRELRPVIERLNQAVRSGSD